VSTLRKGDRGPHVRELQEKLPLLGFYLPRFGPDSHLGQETMGAVNALLASYRESPGVDIDEEISSEELALIDRLYQLRCESPPSRPRDLQDLTEKAQAKSRIKRRPWSQVTGITLHQTACLLGSSAYRWLGIPVHLGVSRLGDIFYLHPFDWVTYHGNGLNSSDVGIEVDGHFAGVEGDLKTYWRPAEDPNRQPLTPRPEQLESVREAVRWICEEVKRNGGQVRYLHAHRQSSGSRQSDPGSAVWGAVAPWARETLGLETPLGKTLGSGRPIPAAWDPLATATY
jgi:hypothetical protein